MFLCQETQCTNCYYLLKIIIDNAKLKENVEPIAKEEETIESDNRFKHVFTFGEDDRTSLKLTFGGYDEHTLYLQKDASITFDAMIRSLENDIAIRLDGIVVRDFGLDFFGNEYTFKNTKTIVQPLEVDEGGNLYLYCPNIPLYLNNDEETDATLSVSIEGTIENPEFSIELNINVPL